MVGELGSSEEEPSGEQRDGGKVERCDEKECGQE